MASDSSKSNMDYPSFESVKFFWQKAVEEYESEDIISQKDGCEKAFRSATESIDMLLANNGYYIPAGKPESHIIREEFLRNLFGIKQEIREVIDQYSIFKNILHGICFYTNANPKKFSREFYLVEEFNQKIVSLVTL